MTCLGLFLWWWVVTKTKAVGSMRRVAAAPQQGRGWVRHQRLPSGDGLIELELGGRDDVAAEAETKGELNAKPKQGRKKKRKEHECARQVYDVARARPKHTK